VCPCNIKRGRSKFGAYAPHPSICERSQVIWRLEHWAAVQSKETSVAQHWQLALMRLAEQATGLHAKAMSIELCYQSPKQCLQETRAGLLLVTGTVQWTFGRA